MTTCVISQPRFFPGLHYLDRMLRADIFVILDTVQFTPRHEENRARLKSRDGSQWLTVPVRRQAREQSILETRIAADDSWRKTALRTLQHLYGKSPHYQTHRDEIETILQTPHETLTEFDRASWQPALDRMGIRCEFVLASDLPVEGQGSDLLLDLCEHVDADTYLSGEFGRSYLDLPRFRERGVTVLFHDYQHPDYDQRFGTFVPYLSYLDMLFNTGLEPVIRSSSA
jgi:hypothetical protein